MPFGLRWRDQLPPVVVDEFENLINDILSHFSASHDEDGNIDEEVLEDVIIEIINGLNLRGQQGPPGPAGSDGDEGPAGPPGSDGGSATPEAIAQAGYWSPLTNGDVDNPELIFVDGDTIAIWTETP